MYTRKRSITLLIILLLACATAITAYAASNEVRYNNFAGITTAIAQKYVSSNPSEVNCASYSLTQYPETDTLTLGTILSVVLYNAATVHTNKLKTSMVI
jgi:hypothetical protein